MEYQWNRGIQNYKNKENLLLFYHSDLLSVYYRYFAPIHMTKNNIFKQPQTTFSLKPLHQLLSNFMKHDQTPGVQNCRIGSGQESKMAIITRNSKDHKSTSSPEPLDIFG